MTIHAAALTTRSTGSNRSIGWVYFAPVALVVVPGIAGIRATAKVGSS